MTFTQNIFTPLAGPISEEHIEKLLTGREFKLERIVSTGQVTPEGEWYDQERDEWVILLSGSARLRFEGKDEEIELKPGDYLNIPAHVRHRVEWTDPAGETVWLAVRYL